MTNASGGMIRPFSTELSALNRLFDGLIIWLSLELLCAFYGVDSDRMYKDATLFALVGFLLLAEAQGVYGSWRLVTLKGMSVKVFLAWLTVTLFLVLLAFLTKTSSLYSRFVMASWFLLVPALLILERLAVQLILRQFRRQGRNLRTVAIAGGGEIARKLADNIQGSNWMGLKLVSCCEAAEEVISHARAGEVDYVFIALPSSEEARIVMMLEALADTTASVYLVPDPLFFRLMNAHWLNVGGIPMVSVQDAPFYGVDGWFKRFEDLVLGSLILILIAFPMGVIATGIRLSSPGPILFRQHRYGLNGRVVEVWKFRSMTVCEDGHSIPQARREDPRVTPFGAFLRRTSLDELPQFINVLQGHMSIVGPRPHAVAHNEQFRTLVQGYMVRHKVKPGITGWAQINGHRGETDTVDKMKARVEYDLHYINHWSLWLDLKIIFLTIIKGFIGKQAY